MTENEIKQLRQDPDGLQCYEFMANHISDLTAEDLAKLVDIMMLVDLNGQFMASAARYLHAIDTVAYAQEIRRLVAATIDKDREHRYLPDLISSIYGEDYKERAEELSASDDNFRRMYKRLYPNPDKL
ncbi:MAG: hypothetical protein K2M79_01965 [Muribaculaceae bacterium]|nr:hypothetical protein [Muribaculaceae bacterium]